LEIIISKNDLKIWVFDYYFFIIYYYLLFAYDESQNATAKRRKRI